MNAAPRTIVITGGNGFVGRYLQEEIRQAWPDTAIHSWDLPDVDITDPRTYEEALIELAPDWVIHLAAIASVSAAHHDPTLTFKVNTEGTKSLVGALQRNSQDTKMLFISTADLYGSAAKDYGEQPIPELGLSQAKPANPYGESKFKAEQYIEKHFNNRCIRVRPFPHIGPGQGLGFVTADFASQIAAIESGTQLPELSVGNLEARRDFTDVRDVVRAYRLLLERGEVGEVYHVASGKAVSIQEILDGLLSKTSLNISIMSDPSRMRPADIPVLTGDAKKLQDATGWEPVISLDQSLTDVLNWWRSH